MPTLCALVGHRPEHDLKWDGRNVWPIINGTEAGAATRPFYTKGPPDAALLQGGWKQIQRKSTTELYHLADDEGETRNQAAENPQIVQRLSSVLNAETANDNDARPRSNP